VEVGVLDYTFVSTALLPLAVAAIMFGLGLALTLEDFARVVQYPRAAVVGLLVQTVVLVPVAFAIAKLLALPPLLAIGLMLLAASPGGAMANVFSHLARGDVALNITLTAINSLLALAWLPLVMNWSLAHFLGAEQYVPPPTQKIMEVATFIVLPVIVGMVLRRLRPALARRAERPVRLASVLLLACVVALTIVTSRDTLAASFAAVGVACIVFNLVSMGLGYAIPRLAALPMPQVISISFEVGVHNAAVAIFMAMQVLKQDAAAVPAALYGLVMIATASITVTWLRHRHARNAVAIGQVQE
jgi:BASS family bile acid:Na+ symporter